MNRRRYIASILSTVAVASILIAFNGRGGVVPGSSFVFDAKEYHLSSPVDPTESAVFIVEVVNRGANEAAANLGSPCRCATFEWEDGEPIANDEIALAPSERRSIRVRLVPTNRLGVTSKRLALAREGVLLDFCDLTFDSVPWFTPHPRFFTLADAKSGETSSGAVNIIGRMPTDRFPSLKVVGSSSEVAARIRPATDAGPVDVDGVLSPVVA